MLSRFMVMLFPVVLGLLRPGLLEEPLVYWSRKTYGPRLLRNLAPGVNSGSLRTSPKQVTFSPWRLNIWDCLALESYMSILTLYPLHKDDVFYLCCKLENTSQTHGSVRSPELIGRNSVVIIVQGLYNWWQEWWDYIWYLYNSTTVLVHFS